MREVPAGEKAAASGAPKSAKAAPGRPKLPQAAAAAPAGFRWR